MNTFKYEHAGRGVPFPHHWLGHWAQRGSTVGKERSSVLQGGGFGDLQGKLGVDLGWARTRSWAVLAWRPLNFVLHLPFCSKVQAKETFQVAVPCTPRQGLQSSLQPAPVKGGWLGSHISHIFNGKQAGWSQEASGQAPLA